MNNEPFNDAARPTSRKRTIATIGRSSVGNWTHLIKVCTINCNQSEAVGSQRIDRRRSGDGASAGRFGKGSLPLLTFGSQAHLHVHSGHRGILQHVRAPQGPHLLHTSSCHAAFRQLNASYTCRATQARWSKAIEAKGRPKQELSNSLHHPTHAAAVHEAVVSFPNFLKRDFTRKLSKSKNHINAEPMFSERAAMPSIIMGQKESRG